MKRLTISDVARELGVSTATVSQAFSGKGTITVERREAVLRAAQELGYRPNSAARAVGGGGKLGCVTLLMSVFEWRSNIPPLLLAGVDEELNRHNMHLNIARLPDEKLASEGFVPKILREWMSDGLLVNYAFDMPVKLKELLLRYELPAIWINTKLEADCVYPNDFEAGRLATEYLLKLGHRRICYVANESNHYSIGERRAGYESAMKAAGLATQSELFQTNIGEEAGRLVARSRTGSNPVTAFVAYESYIASPLLYALSKINVRVPEDVSLVTFGGTAESICGPVFTTVILPEYSMGQTGVQMLQQKIEFPAETLSPRVLDVSLHEGQTCAAQKF